MKHSFKVFYEPACARQPGDGGGIRLVQVDLEVHCCERCGLEVEDPQDAYPIAECGPVEAMTDEWLGLMGHGTDCDLRIVECIHES